MSEAEALSPPSEEPAKGLDAILDSALEGYGDEAPPKEAPADTPAESDGRARDDKGRFVAKDPAEAKPSEPEPAAAATPAEPNTSAEPPVTEPIQPHARWDEALKTQFAAWPRDVQQAFLDRHNAFEGDYTRKTQELAETRKTVEPLVQEVGKWSQYLGQLGMKPEQAFSQMLTTEFTLRTGSPEQRRAALDYLEQLYGVPPRQPAGEGGQQPSYDPSITQLHQTVAGLQSQLRQMSEQRQLDERQRAQAEFDAFGQTKDTNGALKYPHFDRVKNTMIQMVANGLADTWDGAYTKAVRSDDEFYAKSVEEARLKAAADAERQRLEAVEKAKKAQPIKSHDGAPKGGQKLTGLDAHLNAALERAGIG